MSNTPRVGRPSQTTKPDFWYFDRLPPSARQALANACFDWSSGSVYNRWRKGVKGYKTGKDIAERLKTWDQLAIAKQALYNG